MRLLKQKNIGNWWGGVKQSASQLNIYVAFINLVLIAMTAWNTTISEQLESVGITVPFWVFALLIMLFLVVAMVFEYRISIPSFFSFWNSQFWEHDNPIKKELEDVKAELKVIKDMLNEKDNKP